MIGCAVVFKLAAACQISWLVCHLFFRPIYGKFVRMHGKPLGAGQHRAGTFTTESRSVFRHLVCQWEVSQRAIEQVQLHEGVQPRDRTKSNNGAPSRAYHGSSIVSIKDNRTFILVAPSLWPCHPWLRSTSPVSRGLSLDDSTHARPFEEHDHVTSPNVSYRLLQPRIGAVSFPCTSHHDVFDELSSLAFDEIPRPTRPAGPPMRRSHHAAQRTPLFFPSYRDFLEGICFLALEAVGGLGVPARVPLGRIESLPIKGSLSNRIRTRRGSFHAPVCGSGLTCGFEPELRSDDRTRWKGKLSRTHPNLRTRIDPSPSPWIRHAKGPSRNRGFSLMNSYGFLHGRWCEEDANRHGPSPNRATGKFVSDHFHVERKCKARSNEAFRVRKPKEPSKRDGSNLVRDPGDGTGRCRRGRIVQASVERTSRKGYGTKRKVWSVRVRADDPKRPNEA